MVEEYLWGRDINAGVIGNIETSEVEESFADWGEIQEEWRGIVVESIQGMVQDGVQGYIEGTAAV